MGEEHTAPSPPPWGDFSSTPCSMGPPPLLPPDPSPPVYPSLTHLDPGNTGRVSAPALLQHWLALGVAEPSRALQELGLEGAGLLETREVSRLLQEEVSQARELLTYPTVQAGLLTIQAEARVLKGSLDSLGQERDKLGRDLQVANARAELLVQEVDEQQGRQEKETRDQLQALEVCWAEHLKSVTSQAEEEQEATHDKVFQLQRLLSQNSNNFKSIETHLKKDIDNLLKENDRLDVENKSLQQQWRETEELLKNMRREQENIGLLRKHLMTVENGVKITGGPGGRNPDLARQVEELAQMNRELKDKNDELVLHLRPSDGGRTTICMERQIGKAPLIPGTCLYNEDFLSYDDKENTPRPDDNIQRISITGPAEEPAPGHGTGKLVTKTPISGDTKESERNIKKNQQIVSNIFNPFLNTFNCSVLPQDDLDQVKFKIVEILSLKDNYSKENQSLKSHQTAYSELLRQNEELQQKLKVLESCGEGSREVPDLILRVEKGEARVQGVDRSSPDGEERLEQGGKEQQEQEAQEEETEGHKLLLLRTKVVKLEEARGQLLEKNKQIEESLELMSSEFESMEDYWQGKLDSERVWGEEQLRSSEAQFKELEARMREYEELVSSETSRRAGLDTIQEERNLEEKVLGWEEEIQELRSTIEHLEENHLLELEQCRSHMLARKQEHDSVQQEVKQLQELRSSVQEECDNLMKRKQELQQEIGVLEGGRKEASPCPPPLASPYTSVCAAYRVILEDIHREKEELEEAVSQHPPDLLQQRLGQQVNRCKQLQSVLALQREEAGRRMEDRREQHREEMVELEALVTSSQALVTRQNRQFIQQMDGMVAAGTVIEQLLQDNRALTQQLKNIKKTAKIPRN